MPPEKTKRRSSNPLDLLSNINLEETINDLNIMKTKLTEYESKFDEIKFLQIIVAKKQFGYPITQEDLSMVKEICGVK